MRFTMRSRLSRSFVVLAKVDMFSSTRLQQAGASPSAGRRPPTAFRLRLSHLRLRRSPFLDPLLKPLAPKNPLHEDARSMNHIRVQFSWFDQVFDFSNRNLSGGCHHRIEIARGFTIDKVAPSVALP